MATAVTMLPESALRECVAESGRDAEGEILRTKGRPVNPELAIFTNCQVDELLMAVVEHIEEQLAHGELIDSPRDVPSGIRDSHTRQIEVCLARFKAAKIPAVSIREYLLRLHQHCPFSTAKLLALVHYITVLDVLYLEISKVLRRNTAHRLILTAIVIASKILDDRLMPQVRWSVVGGISLHQLHGLELAFFFLMNGKCWITEESLVSAGKYLTGQTGRKENTVLPMLETEEADVIWSSVGNRKGQSRETEHDCEKGDCVP